MWCPKSQGKKEGVIGITHHRETKQKEGIQTSTLFRNSFTGDGSQETVGWVDRRQRHIRSKQRQVYDTNLAKVHLVSEKLL